MAYNLDVKNPKLQPSAILNQANPVQNTWYTILDTTGDLEIFLVAIAIITTGETLECRLTIDGVIPNIISGLAAVAGTTYPVAIYHDHTGMWLDATVSNSLILRNGQTLRCRAFKAEVRKTTNAGAGNLRGAVSYSKV